MSQLSDRALHRTEAVMKTILIRKGKPFRERIPNPWAESGLTLK